METKRVCAMMVPKNLTDDPWLRGEQVCNDLSEKTEDEPNFLVNVIIFFNK
jgi:hypothetical protein